MTEHRILSLITLTLLLLSTLVFATDPELEFTRVATRSAVVDIANAAIVTYMIDSPALAGEFPIQSVVVNNVPLCEALQ